MSEDWQRTCDLKIADNRKKASVFMLSYIYAWQLRFSLELNLLSWPTILNSWFNLTAVNDKHVNVILSRIVAWTEHVFFIYEILFGIYHDCFQVSLHILMSSNLRWKKDTALKLRLWTLQSCLDLLS